MHLIYKGFIIIRRSYTRGIPLMKKILLLLITTIFACGTPVREQPPVTTPPCEKADALSEFFNRCEQDMEKASQVVVQEDIIKNLTHLHRMDSGGKKYYILERDAISRMIHSVTQDIYSDFIIINGSGTVIYTAHNDYFFGKNIRTDIRTSSLAECAKIEDDGIHIHDVAILNTTPATYAVFLSRKVYGKNSFPGTFILQLDTEEIARIFKVPTEIIGADGKYRIASRDRILLPYPSIETVTRCKALDAGGSVDFRDNSTEYRCRDFRYRGLSWFVISQGPL